MRLIYPDIKDNIEGIETTSGLLKWLKNDLESNLTFWNYEDMPQLINDLDSAFQTKDTGKSNHS